MQCVLKGQEKSDYYVNVTTNIWNGTFAMVNKLISVLFLYQSGLILGLAVFVCSLQADFLYTVLSVRADIETSQPELLFIEQKHLQVQSNQAGSSLKYVTHPIQKNKQFFFD